MSKMGSHHPFGHWKHKLWPKEKSWVKLAIWLFNTKSHKLTRFPCVQVACDIPLEISQWGLQCCFRPHFNWRSIHKVMGPQSRESPNFGNFGTPIWKFQDSHLGISRQNAIWMWASWRGIKYTIRGKVVGSPKSGSWWVLWVRVCPWLVLAPKVLQLCTN
jgi:hypothetical protein